MKLLTITEKEARDTVFRFYLYLDGLSDAGTAIKIVLSLITLKYLNDQANAEGIEVNIPEEARWGKLLDNQHTHVIEGLSVAYAALEGNNPWLTGINMQLNTVENLYQVLRKNSRFSEDILNFIHLLSAFDFANPDFSFKGLFEWLLDMFNESAGWKSSLGNLPKELAELMIYFLPKASARIYNPYARVADLAPYLPTQHFCYGQEAHNTSVGLGILRMLAHGTQHYELHQQLPSEHWFWEDEPPEPVGTFMRSMGRQHHFDVVMSMPPFGSKIKKPYSGKSLPSEAWFLKKLSESVQPHQKAFILLTPGSLFRQGQEGEIRKNILKQDLVETVISLPAGLLRNTNIPLVLWVLNGAKKNKGSITLIDAKGFAVKQKHQSILELEKVLELVETNKPTAHKMEVSLEEVAKNGYNLNLPRYFIPDITPEPGAKLLPLKDLLVASKKKAVKDVGFGRLLKISDLSNDAFDYKKSFETLEPREMSGSYHLLIDGELLLALQGQSLRPTLFDAKTGTEVYYPSSVVMAFGVNEDIVNPNYLINELNADYVQAQLTKYGRETGLSFPYITRSSLLNHVKIQVPSLEVQQARAKRLSEQSKRLKRLQDEREAILAGNAQQQYTDYASLKHTLGTPRQNILSWANSLINFFSKMQSGDFQRINQQFIESTKDGVSLEQVASIIRQDIIHISKVLEGGVREFDPSTYQLTPVPLNELKAFVKGLSAANYNFSLNTNFSSDFDANTQAQGLDFNLDLLKVLIDNLLTNASKHGFATKEKANKVMINLSIAEGGVVLEVKNNGKPFPQGYTKKNFTTKFSTRNTSTGSGLGGYDIDRIAQYLGNKDWELLQDDELHPVVFRFQFKLITLI